MGNEQCSGRPFLRYKKQPIFRCVASLASCVADLSVLTSANWQPGKDTITPDKESSKGFFEKWAAENSVDED